MKKLTNNEMLQVHGGGEFAYRDTCKGQWAAHKRTHSTLIEGSGSSPSAAIDDFDDRLRAHKKQLYQHTHSLNTINS